MVGGFFFYEERDWDEGNARVLYDTWGFGVDMGAMVHALPRSDEHAFSLGFLPYFRLAMGVSDGDFTNVPIQLPGEVGTSSGEMGDLRFDVGMGVEARAVVAQTFFVGVGVGVNWWTTAEGASGTTRNGGGVVIIVDDAFDFHGDETYVRVSVGFLY
jgi:hypothetical protein